MRILIYTNSIGARGGIERVTIVKANYFAQMPGIEVAICYTDKGTYPEQMIHPLSPNVKVLDAGVSFWDLYPLSLKNILFTGPKKFLALRKAFIRIISEFKPDIVISTGSYEKFALASINPSKITHRPCVKIREYHFNSNYRKYIDKSLIVSIAGWIEDKLLGRMFDMNYLLTKEDQETNFKGRRSYDYHYNPLSFNCDSVVVRKNIVVAVGRLVDQKNFAALLRIWANVAVDTDYWELWIVGEGEQRTTLEGMAKELDVATSVRFLGFRKEIKEIFAQCKIIAFTSKYEGFGVSLIEAMACGVVPVSYRTPYGPADIITHNKNGMLVEYMNEAQFAETLKSLINDEDKIQSMSLCAADRAKDFAPELIIPQLIEKYKSLLQLH